MIIYDEAMNLLKTPSKKLWVLFLPFIIVLGVFVRLDQFLIQTLIDDEWHAVHQLLYSSPDKIFTSFGISDYSIPLTLFYWFEAKMFGLSELLMRWPIMFFGLVTLVSFPIVVYRRFSEQETLIFGFLLAMSPLLTAFSRTARPYTITLFLVYFSIWIFYRYYNNSSKRVLHGGIYCFSAALAIWLHIIAAFFIIAPFILEFIKIIFKQNSGKVRRFLPLIYLGLPTLMLTSVLILPPLLHDISALSTKSGSDLPTLDTFIGSLYLFFGSYSGFVIVVCSILALIGVPRLMKKSIIAQNILLGFVMTLIVIFFLQPKWVQHSITFSRYLLPVIPVLLLSVASGFFTLHKLLDKNKKGWVASDVFSLLVLLIMFVAVIITSPIRDFIVQPNTNVRHLKYTFEFREEKNEITQFMQSRPLSKFWYSLADNPLQKKIAVAPWYFKSFYWDAPRWEKASKQYIIPGYLLGLCVKQRMGEVPNNARFDFRNVSYLDDIVDNRKRGIDLIVFQKQERFKHKSSHDDLEGCDVALQDLYGKPIYEDMYIKVFETSIEEKKID